MPDLDLNAARDARRLLMAHDLMTLAPRIRILLGKARDVISVPARLASEAASAGPGWGVHQVRLSEGETQALIGLDHPGTVNELLMAALHLAIAVWNAEHAKRCGRIGVLMPVNLRPPEWHEELMGNFTLMARLVSTPEQRSLEGVLPAVTAQTRLMKAQYSLAALIEFLGRTAFLPVWAKKASAAVFDIAGNRLVDTAELSNLGFLKQPQSFDGKAGETRELWFSPPARMPLGLSVGAVTAAGCLHLAFRYRLALFGPQTAADFASLYLSVMRLLVESRERPGAHNPHVVSALEAGCNLLVSKPPLVD
jgi:hypothetical protein